MLLNLIGRRTSHVHVGETQIDGIEKRSVVEAAGVEPASENVTGQETTCLVQFMLLAFTRNVRGLRSERTRNGDR